MSISSTTRFSAGTRRSPARPHDPIDLVLAGAEDLDQLPDQPATRVTHLEPDEVVPVVGTRRQLVRRHLEIATDDGVGGLAAVDPGEVHDQGAASGLDAVDMRGLRGAVEPHLGTGRDPLGPIGQRLDTDGAAQPFRAQDPGDRQAAATRRR